METRRLSLAVLSVIAVLATMVPATAWAGTPTAELLYAEEFDSAAGVGWSTTYNTLGGDWGFSYGSTEITAGVLSVRPSTYRGGSRSWTDDHVVTSLPAHVQMRVRFLGSAFQYSSAELGPEATMDDLGQPLGRERPTYVFRLGTTGSVFGAASQRLIGHYFADTGYEETATATTQLIPSDTWTDVDILLFDDRVEYTYLGATTVLEADVKGDLQAAGGFKFGIATGDDYGPGGLDIDYLRIDQAPFGTSIAGNVYDRAGTPLEGIIVRAYEADEAWYGDVGSALVTETITVADGSYSLVGMYGEPLVIAFCDPTGTYRDVTWPGRGWPVEMSPAIDPTEKPTDVDAHMVELGALRDGRVQRVAGRDRYSTALAISRANFSSADTAVVVSGEVFADALSAAPLAGLHEAPILLTMAGRLPSGLTGELDRLGVTNVIIVGGTASVSEGVAKSLSTPSRAVTRFSGRDRYDAAARVALEVDRLNGGGLEPFIVRGDVFADAMSLSPFAYMEGRPIVLTQPDDLPSSSTSAWNWISRDGNNYAIIAGGTLSVTEAVLDELAATSWDGDLNYWRLAGPDRYATGKAIIDAYGGPFDVMGVASGEVFPDALAGGAAMGRVGGPVVLTQGASLSRPAVSTLRDNGPYALLVECFGGERTVAPGTLTQVKTALGTKVYDIDDPSGRVPLAAALGITDIAIERPELLTSAAGVVDKPAPGFDSSDISPEMREAP